MRLLRFLFTCLLFVFLAFPIGAQDWHGQGRVDGWVKDQNGQPIPDAAVHLARPNGQGPSTKSDKKGYWAFLGLASGAWNLDVTAAGYEPSKKSLSISQETRMPPMDIRLQKAAPTEAAATGVDPAAQKGAEAVADVTEGNQLLNDKKFAEARASYEKAMALLPPNAGLWKGVAQTYHLEGNEAKAIEALQKSVEIDPSDTNTKLLLASMLVAQGQSEEGKTLLDSLPPDSVKDPAVYVNLGITFINKKKLDDAVIYLSKAIDLDPTQASTYYYRGMASFQLKKNAEAKADFKKCLELAPGGPEAKDAKEMLQALK